MPWRLIIFLLVLTLFIIFSGFNTHRIEINIGPWPVKEIPLFVALFLFFLMGAVVTLPLTLISTAKKNKRNAETISSTKSKFIEKRDETIESSEENKESTPVTEPIEPFEPIEQVEFGTQKKKKK